MAGRRGGAARRAGEISREKDEDESFHLTQPQQERQSEEASEEASEREGGRLICSSSLSDVIALQE